MLPARNALLKSKSSKPSHRIQQGSQRCSTTSDRDCYLSWCEADRGVIQMVDHRITTYRATNGHRPTSCAALTVAVLRGSGKEPIGGL